MNKQKGFTLIELLVVISIIGLLSSIVSTSVSASKIKARESKRVQELRQVELALQLYADDNGGYPWDGYTSNDNINTPDAALLTCFSGDNGIGGNAAEASGLDLLVPKYISRLPVDPINNGQLCYRYFSTAGSEGVGTRAATFTFVSEIKKVQGSSNNALIGVALGQPSNLATGANGYPGYADAIINSGFNNTY